MTYRLLTFNLTTMPRAKYDIDDMSDNFALSARHKLGRWD